MPRFEPFTGIHYNASIDPENVMAPPYDVLSPADRAELAHRDPHNIVHIDVPDPAQGDEWYGRASSLMHQWLQDAVLQQDAVPCLYLYRMAFTDVAGKHRHVVGVIGGLEVVPTGQGDVLPHEETTPKDKTDRYDLTVATRANMSPVWGLSLTHGLSDLLEAPGESMGLVHVEGVTHSAERVVDPDRIAAIQDAVQSSPVVIADGHHRYEVARRYRASSGLADAELTMTLVMELTEEQLAVQAIHRLISGVDSTEFIASLDAHFVRSAAGVVNAEFASAVVDCEALCLVHASGAGEWLTPRPHTFAGVADLDSARLRFALRNIVHDVAYQHGVDLTVNAVASGRAQYAVLLRPVSVPAIRQLAAERGLMPPKSTFFVPKPRTGFVIRPMQ